LGETAETGWTEYREANRTFGEVGQHGQEACDRAQRKTNPQHGQRLQRERYRREWQRNRNVSSCRDDRSGGKTDQDSAWNRGSNA
jgi:hypothetical protein